MSVKGLLKAVQNRKHVDGLPWGHMPAAAVVNMQFWRVMSYLPKLKLYKPKKK